MRGTWVPAVLVVLAVAGTGDAAEPEDRLGRFSDLGRRLSGAAEISSPADPEAALEELFALADAEIIDNLRSGEPFASPAFIQERLDTFMAVWGGARFRVHRLGWAGGPAPLTLGVFGVPGAAPRGSVRGYGRTADGAVALLAAIAHEGMPEIHSWPAARSGAPQFVATWLGAPAGPMGRPLVVELWRDGSPRGLQRVWSLGSSLPEALWALGLTVKSGEISIRYEPRYPGFKPGCEGQTQQIDRYRQDARCDGLALVSRRVVNGWHRELQAAVARLLTGLAAGDQAVLRELVPDAALRTRLPRTLAAEPACDQAGPGTPPPVDVAATDERGGRMVPWSLSWRRGPRGWRLSAAAPVLD